MRDALANKTVAQAGKTLRSEATSRANSAQAQKGASRLPVVLKSPALLTLAATGLASAAAAFLYRRANRTQPVLAAGEAKTAPEAATTSGPQRTRRPKAQDADSSSAPTGDSALIGVARPRKKRSDAGVKRGPRLKKANLTGSVADQLVPELKTTDTSIIALTAGADTSAHLGESPAELEAAVHPN